MPRLPGWAWLLLAGVFAALASYLALGWLQRQTAQKPAVTQVVEATTAVGPDTLLNAGQLGQGVWKQPKPPQDFFAEVKDVAGQRETKTALKAGELITRANTREKRLGLTAMLGSEHRAMTVKVDEASGVAGFLAPGDRVDVVVVVSKGEFNAAPLARLLMQNLKVLGTGQKLEHREDDKPQIVPTVTLEVTPAEGERLALAGQAGRISLVLRGQGEQHLVHTGGVSAVQLFGEPEKAKPAVPAAAPAAPPRRTVEVIRGLERQSANF